MEASMSNHLQMQALTPREHQVLQLIGNGLTSKEIAQRLNISHYTIGAHRRNICLKLGIHSSAELVSFETKNTSSVRTN
jgi:DNA-binding CsgD family transcriptional regulator